MLYSIEVMKKQMKQNKNVALDPRASDNISIQRFRDSLDLSKIPQSVKSIVSHVTGMVGRKAGLPLVNWFDRIGHQLVGTTKSNIRVYKSFSLTLWKLNRSGGLKYVCVYLKACSVLLQQAIGGQVVSDTRPLGCAVSRTKRGLPTIIPALHRARILRRELPIMRLWLTLFNVYRILEVPGKLKLNTITDSPVESMVDAVKEFEAYAALNLMRILKRSGAKDSLMVHAFVAKDKSEFLNKMRARPFVLFKASPVLGGSNYLEYISTSVEGITLASFYLVQDSVVWPSFERYARLTGNQWMLNRISSLNHEMRRHEMPEGYHPLGKLGLKQEPAGKVRVFAMVDCWTQWLLYPLHAQIFSFLSKIPADGTFDQGRPIRHLMSKMAAKGQTETFCYDLSAATDRLPIALQVSILSMFFGPTFAEAWSNILIGRGYKLFSKEFRVNQTLYYGCGQPMGALSSWGMLALTHHLIVQWAFSLAYPEQSVKGVWFDMYAVLGDDIVISDKRVAEEYLKLMKRLGVGINLAKSLVGNASTIEFAKKFWTPQDTSPIPFKELLVASRSMPVLLEYSKKYNLRLPDILHILGYGYKVKGNLTKPITSMSRTLARLVVAVTAPGSILGRSFTDWLVMKSLTASDDHADWDRVLNSFFDSEKARLLRKMETLRPWVEVARRLSTVYRDREHYGTVTVAPATDQEDHPITGWSHLRNKGNPRLRTALITTSRYKFLTIHMVDLICEELYRPAFLHVAEIFNALEVEIGDLKWDPLSTDPKGEIEALWSKVSTIEEAFANLPLPKGLEGRSKPKTPRNPLIEKAKLWFRLRNVMKS